MSKAANSDSYCISLIIYLCKKLFISFLDKNDKQFILKEVHENFYAILLKILPNCGERQYLIKLNHKMYFVFKLF